MSSDHHDENPRTLLDEAPVVKPVRKRGKAVLFAALLLIAVGLLNLVSGLGLLGAGYYFLNANPYEVEEQMRTEHPEELASLYKNLINMADALDYAAFGSFGLGLLTCVLAFPILFGGTAMLRMRGYYGALFGSFLAVILPGGFYLLGPIAGLTAFIVLLMPSVRRSFR
jgi:hypothetical protein